MEKRNVAGRQIRDASVNKIPKINHLNKIQKSCFGPNSRNKNNILDAREELEMVA